MLPGRFRPWTYWGPVACVAIFVFLYAVAALLYPGGSKGAPESVGFSLVHNYWCDLLDEKTYGGRLDPARPVAIVAMTILCVGLAVLWWSAPVLFPDAPRRAALTRVAGVSSAALTPWVASRFHDRVIDLAGLLGMVSFLATMSALRGRGGRALGLVGACAFVLASANYSLWRIGVGLSAVPAIQKAAFLAFFSWVVILARRIGTAIAPGGRPGPQPAPRT